MKLTRQAKFTDYDGFVEKFKPKKTTDDCYTPQPFYDALAKWLRENVPLAAQSDPWLRPFYPGGDYLNEDYPENCAVIDNPPFSILAQIVRNYMAAGVRFWLFGPHLTLSHYLRFPGVTVVIANACCTYANGAKVNTSFVTNMWPTDAAYVISGSLNRALKDTRELKPKRPVILYPDNVVSSALLGKYAVAGVDLEIPRECFTYVSDLKHRDLFGGGGLISNGMAAELRAAELRAAELRAAELRAAELRAAEELREKGIVVQLSEDELIAIDTLADAPKKYRI